MSLVLSDADVLASGLTEAELRVEIAVLLYAQDRISLGKAAELAGVSLQAMMHALAEHDVVLNYSVDDFERDLATIEKLRRA